MVAEPPDLDRVSVTFYNGRWIARRSYHSDHLQGRLLTLAYRPTQPEAAAHLQRWVKSRGISIRPKQTKPINSKSMPHSCRLCLSGLRLYWPTELRSRFFG